VRSNWDPVADCSGGNRGRGGTGDGGEPGTDGTFPVFLPARRSGLSGRMDSSGRPPSGLGVTEESSLCFVDRPFPRDADRPSREKTSRLSPVSPDGTPWAGSDWIDVIASGTPGAATAWQPLSTSHRRSTGRRDLLSRSSAGPMNAGTTFAYAVFTSFVANAARTVWGWPGGDSDSQRSGEWFPALPSCPGAQTPCARDALLSALKPLRSRMLNNCPECSTWVFSKLGESNQQQFYQYLAREPRFFDGTRSTAPINRMCGPMGNGGWLRWLSCDYGDWTVKQYMARHEATAISETPSERNMGMMVFFNPNSVCRSAGSTPSGVVNQALLFHEGLHGFSGLVDSSLMTAFGINPGLSSIEISYYLQDHVLGGGSHSCAN